MNAENNQSPLIEYMTFKEMSESVESLRRKCRHAITESRKGHVSKNDVRCLLLGYRFAIHKYYAAYQDVIAYTEQQSKWA